MKLAAILVLVCSCGLTFAQQESKPLDENPWDLGVWTAGGFSVPGGTKDTQVFDVGVRIGRVLTGDHGPGFMRGNFEWAADLMPVYYVIQPVKNAYGAGFNPVNLKWNFTKSARTIPYFELGGGVLFTNREVPTGTSAVNFLPHAALGVHYFVRPRWAVSFNVRYEHISSAGLASPNPGVNTVQIQVGLNRFK
jgi:lipid A 3-O-deacylase